MIDIQNNFDLVPTTNNVILNLIGLNEIVYSNLITIIPQDMLDPLIYVGTNLIENLRNLLLDYVFIYKKIRNSNTSELIELKIRYSDLNRQISSLLKDIYNLFNMYVSDISAVFTILEISVNGFLTNQFPKLEDTNFIIDRYQITPYDLYIYGTLVYLTQYGEY